MSDNVQFATDAGSQIIVGVSVDNEGSDQGLHRLTANSGTGKAQGARRGTMGQLCDMKSKNHSESCEKCRKIRNGGEGEIRTHEWSYPLLP